MSKGWIVTQANCTYGGAIGHAVNCYSPSDKTQPYLMHVTGTFDDGFWGQTRDGKTPVLVFLKEAQLHKTAFDAAHGFADYINNRVAACQARIAEIEAEIAGHKRVLATLLNDCGYVSEKETTP